MLHKLPIKTRLTLAFTCLLAIVLVISGFLLMAGFRVHLDATIDAEIGGLAEEYAGDIDSGETDVLHDFTIAEAPGLFARVFAADGTLVDAKPSSVGELVPPKMLTPGQPLVVSVQFDTSSSLPVEHARVAWAAARNGSRIAIGRPLDERDRTLAAFRTLLLAVGSAMLVVVAALGWLTSRAALAPVERLRAEASLISEGTMDRRLPIPGTGDEIARLAETLNEMLARLQTGIERERRIIDDASHELRTPLSVLRTELDLALRRSRTKAELRNALAGAADTSAQLNRLAEDMLVLARANQGQLPLDPHPTDISALVVEAVAELEGTASRREVGIETEFSPDQGLMANVDAVRIRQVLRNLLDNALSFCPDGGRVKLAVAADAGWVRIVVTDTGPGLDETFFARAFEPYAKLDAGRSGRTGGAGLGLTLVKSIVEAHGGTVELNNAADGGAAAVVRLPECRSRTVAGEAVRATNGSSG